MMMMRKWIFLLPVLAAVLPLGAADLNFRWRLDGAAIELTVAPGCYVYASSVEIKARGADGESLKIHFPPAAEHDDEFMGKSEVFAAGAHRFTGESGVFPVSAVISYQGCREASGNESGMCFMPQEITLEKGVSGPVSNPSETTESSVISPSLLTDLAAMPIRRVHEGSADVPAFLAFLNASGAPAAPAATMFDGLGGWMIILLVLLGGLGLNLTPCVLPMIPINLAIIGAEESGRGGGFLRGLAYGGGMALAYGVLGAVVVLTGARFGALNSSAAFNFAIAAVFVLLALAMFEVFSLDFSRYQNSVRADRFGSGRLLTALVLGATAALLAGACVAPVVIGVVLFAARLYGDGNYFGLALPFLLGIGMALPWPLAGAGLGVLPKPGAWMVRIKQAFGVLILLAACYYGYLGYTLLAGDYEPKAQITALELALKQAREERKPLLIDFWATWCKNCREMERTTLRDEAVKKELERFVVVKFQTEKLSDPEVSAILNYFGLQGLPAFVTLEESAAEK